MLKLAVTDFSNYVYESMSVKASRHSWLGVAQRRLLNTYK